MRLSPHFRAHRTASVTRRYGRCRGVECSQSASRARKPVTSAIGWSSIMWCHASGTSMTGATRPSCSYMYSPISRRDQPVLRSKQGHATRNLTQQITGRHPAALVEDVRVELPRPPAFDWSQRGVRDVFHDVRQRRRLVGHSVKVRQSLLDGRVSAQRTERLPDARRLHLGVRLAHPGVEEHEPCELVAVLGGGRDPDPAAHAVRDHDRWHRDARMDRHRDELARPGSHVVALAPAALAVSGEVERHHAVLAREHRRDVVPPTGMGRAAVHEHEARPLRRAPSQVVDRAALDLHHRLVGHHREGVEEPLRNVHTAIVRRSDALSVAERLPRRRRG